MISPTQPATPPTAADSRAPTAPALVPWGEGMSFPGTPFRELIADQAPDLDLDAVFDYSAYLEHVPEVVKRLDSIEAR